MQKCDMYSEHEKLVYYIFNKMKLFHLSEQDREDWIQDGKMHLWKIVNTYIDNNECVFTTFACNSLTNFYLRKIHSGKVGNRKINTISIQTKVNDSDTTIEDLLIREDSFEDKIIDKIVTNETNESIDNILDGRDKYIFKLLMDGKTQTEIAHELGVTRQLISNKVRSIRPKLQYLRQCI